MNRAMRRSQEFKIHLLGGAYGTHMTCQEAKCEAYAKGWVSVIDISSEAGAWQATFIKDRARRRFFEFPAAAALEEAYTLEAQGVLTVTDEFKAMLERVPPGMAVFFFPPGQQCFREHVDREVKFMHDGYEHVRPLDFNEDFNIEADKVNTAKRRG